MSSPRRSDRDEDSQAAAASASEPGSEASRGRGAAAGAGAGAPAAPARGSRRGSRRVPKRGRDFDSEPSSHPGRAPSSDRTGRDDDDDDEEGEGDELVNVGFDRIMNDYRAKPTLDRYDTRDLDDREFESMDAEARAAAERALDREDAKRQRRAVPMALRDDEDESDAGFRAQRRRRRMEQAAVGDTEPDEDVPFNLDSFNVPLHVWIQDPMVQAEVRRRFRTLLQTYTDDMGNNVYEPVIEKMCSDNKQSLEVNFNHIVLNLPTVAAWLVDQPSSMLGILDSVAKEVVLSKYEDYELIQSEIFVRITDLPIADKLRDLRQFHLGALIKVTGVVTRRTGVFPQLKVASFNCTKCGNVTGPITVLNEKDINVGMCPECQSHGPFVLNSEQTIYRNFQKITLQESPGTVPAGRVPRSKEVILLADLVDSCRPGEEVEITGIYTNNFDASLNTRQGFPVFATVLEANYVQKQKDIMSMYKLTEENKREIQALSKDPNIGDRIIKSLAPSIYGHEHVKTALAMSLFGGQEKDVARKHRIRGDINVLLLGDPGTAKSQFLKYVEKTAYRAVFTTGKGASAVGLTAAVHRDPLTGEWTLEGGALVLADRGTCLIDEFDKMNDADRTSIHEAMEQQSISISKAGIVTTLQARCGVIAAANPIGGRYDASKTFSENVQLTDPIIQRFDILCVLQDTVDPVSDERLAKFVVDSHIRSHPSLAEAVKNKEAGAGGAAASASTADADGTGAASSLSAAAIAAGAEAVPEADPDIIPQDLLKKYLIYARQYIQPTLSHINADKVATLYSDLRRESEVSNGIPIAVRHIESIMRMAEANARMHLRSVVYEEDVDMAIRVMLESFIQAQKFGVMRQLRRQFSKYLTYRVQFNSLLLFQLQQLVKEYRILEASRTGDVSDQVVIPFRDLEARAQTLGIVGATQKTGTFLNSQELKDAGFVVNMRAKTITRHF